MSLTSKMPDVSGDRMVGVTGIEPVTPTMSTRLVAQNAGVSIRLGVGSQAPQPKEIGVSLGEFWATIRRTTSIAEPPPRPSPGLVHCIWCAEA